jgi:SAM-dependent MidA family methyltransferase
MREKSPTASRILSEIEAEGPLTFARFMSLALYDSVLGYYAGGRNKIGKSGDYFTNVSVGEVFGNLLAGQFREMWFHLGRPRPFLLVEQGANDGQLARDILSSMADEMLSAVECWIVEPFSKLRRQQEQTLKEFGTLIHWAEGIQELRQFNGVHFSNELVDSFPFHLLRSTGSRWQELCVAARDGRLILSVCEPQDLLAEQVKALPHRAKGTIVELRPAACEWVRSLGRKLRTGFVLVIDYGVSRHQLLAPHRKEGTFACYRAHRRDFRPLEDPGEKDITAHVDFTALAEAALECGFRLEGYADQHHFVVGAAQDLLKNLESPLDRASEQKVRSLKTLLHPEGMGTQFQYLALSKGVDPLPQLSGFQFSRDPYPQLFANEEQKTPESEQCA